MEKALIYFRAIALYINNKKISEQDYINIMFDSYDSIDFETIKKIMKIDSDEKARAIIEYMICKTYLIQYSPNCYQLGFSI